jgi:putative ABC transport system substrate-binding protein
MVLSFPYRALFSVILSGLSCLAFLTPSGDVAAATGVADMAGAVKNVAVTAIVEHSALNAIRDGIKDQLTADGYIAGKNLKFDYQSAQGNNGTAAQIARKFVGDHPDVVVAIATPSAQPLVAATKTIPIVFAGVTDPVGARLVKNWHASGTNVTGVSDMSPLDAQMDLLLKIVSTAKRIGVIYNPGEVNSVSIVTDLKKILTTRGLTLVEAASPRSVDVGSAAQSLVGKADVIYTPTDNNVMSAFESVVKVAQQAKLPLFSADTSAAQRGAAAAMGLNYYDMGRQTGKIVVRILKGEAPGSIAIETSDKLELFVNPEAAHKQGLTLSPELIKSAKTVIRQGVR